ncbi:MAG: alginate lyase family protein, partial [Acidobacteriota bacterium]|nr:alginate lyase family protein [Acidobacteriota bacterium]
MQKNWREGAARLRAMPWEEIRLRFRQEAGKRIDRLIYGLGFSLSSLELKPAPKLVQLNSRPAGAGTKVPSAVRGSGQFFFSTPEVQPILAIMRQRFAEESAKILQRAERICRHQFDLLGFEKVDYGKEIDWLLDPLHQKRWPRRPWYQLCENECGDDGDLRIVFEINRHQHLVTLAKALLLAPEPRFLAELLYQWRSWQRENRYPMGINWSSSYEVALRSLAWLWVGHLLSASALAPKSFQAELLRALAENGRRIERYLEPGHASYIGEATGLFFIGTLCPRLRSAARWQDLGWRLIQEEAQKRVRADGMHRDESVYYHVYALDFFLHCRILAWSNGIPIPEFLDRTIVQMLELLTGISQAGFPPRFGDDDGGRVLDGARNRAEHMLDPLSTGAALYGRADFKSASPGLTEETLWLLGPEAASRFDAIPLLPATSESAVFRESGLYVMTGGQDPRPAMNAGASVRSPQIVIRASAGNGAAHGHDDALSVHLSVGGDEWLVDPGTFTFNSGSAHPISGRSSGRERYSRAAAHNRLVVDGENPLGAAGDAVLLAGPPPLWAAGRQFDLFRGGDDRPGGDGKPVVRERWVFQLKSQFWLVRDVAMGSDEHELEIFWRFAPGFVPSYTPPGFTLIRRAK